MVVTLKSPGSHWGSFFFFARGPGGDAVLSRTQQGDRFVENNDSKRTKLRQLGAADFARLSSSMQLTLLIIRRAQLSSRKTIATTGDQKTRQGGF
jgi:hypothetical protein